MAVDIFDAAKSYRFELEAMSEEDFKELFDILIWIRENATTNGRVHFEIHGGVYNGGQWLRGEIKFTNDSNGDDAAHFKLRWVDDDHNS